jgi:hypothetical protein
MEKEIWKDIPGYNDYQVSNLGNVKSLKFGKEKLLKQSSRNNTKNIYYRVCLTKNGKYYHFNTHQLVAIGFLNHVPDGHNIVIDHINNNKLDNRVENLQLTTARHNLSKDKINCSSKYTGVYWYKITNKWKTQIQFGKKVIALGYYNDELEAAKIYQIALDNINLFNGDVKQFRNLIQE